MTVRKVWQVAFVTLLCFSVVEAQEQERREGQRQGQRSSQGRSRRGGGSFGSRGGFSLNKLRLLGVKQVQEEIKLDDEQKELIGESLKEHGEKTRKLREGIDWRSLGEEERREKYTELVAKTKKLDSETEDVVLLLLDDVQSKRLTEVTVQSNGIGALNLDFVKKDLKISEDLQKKIQEASTAARTERFNTMRKLFEEAQQEAGGDRDKARDIVRKKMEEQRKESDKKVLALLSDSQRKQFEEMKGEKFQLDMRALFSSFSRGGNRSGGQSGGRSGGNNRRPGGGEGRRPGGEDGGNRPRRPE